MMQPMVSCGFTFGVARIESCVRTIVAEHAGDLIGELTLAMTHGIGLKKIAATIHPIPQPPMRSAGWVTNTNGLVFHRLSSGCSKPGLVDDLGRVAFSPKARPCGVSSRQHPSWKRDHRRQTLGPPAIAFQRRNNRLRKQIWPASYYLIGCRLASVSRL